MNLIHWQCKCEWYHCVHMWQLQLELSTHVWLQNTFLGFVWNIKMPRHRTNSSSHTDLCLSFFNNIFKLFRRNVLRLPSWRHFAVRFSGRTVQFSDLDFVFSFIVNGTVSVLLRRKNVIYKVICDARISVGIRPDGKGPYKNVDVCMMGWQLFWLASHIHVFPQKETLYVFRLQFIRVLTSRECRRCKQQRWRQYEWHLRRYWSLVNLIQSFM